MRPRYLFQCLLLVFALAGELAASQNRIALTDADSDNGGMQSRKRHYGHNGKFKSDGIYDKGKEQPPLRVYLDDGDTGKTVADALVQLEQPGMPPIKLSYDQKAAYYYHAQKPPRGYNTFVVHHPKYAEKGYQSPLGFQQEYHLELHTPLNVSYVFDAKLDSLFVLGKNKTFATPGYRKLYVEDPYKIAAKIPYDGNCAEIVKRITDACPELEPINPYYEPSDAGNLAKDLPCDRPKFDMGIFGLEGGYPGEASYLELGKLPVLFFRKKDASKFLRFNDPILAKLNQLDEIRIFGLVYLKATYIGKKRYRDAFTSKLDAHNAPKPGDDPSRVALYDGYPYPVYGNNKYMSEFDYYGRPTEEPMQKSPDRKFYLIPFDACPKVESRVSPGTTHLAQLRQLEGLGLGILDLLEVYCIENKTYTPVGLEDLDTQCED